MHSQFVLRSASEGFDSIFVHFHDDGLEGPRSAAESKTWLAFCASRGSYRTSLVNARVHSWPGSLKMLSGMLEAAATCVT